MGELILGAWSCGQGKAPPDRIARMFHDALLGSGDVAGVFKRVIFAIPPIDENKTLHAFMKQFSDDSPSAAEEGEPAQVPWPKHWGNAEQISIKEKMARLCPEA